MDKGKREEREEGNKQVEESKEGNNKKMKSPN